MPRHPDYTIDSPSDHRGKPLLRAIKIVAVVFGLLLSLFIAGAAYITLSFDTGRVKSELARMVQEKWQRTLNIDGDLKLSFWPGLGVKLGHATLSERDSGQTFAALDSARFSVRILPLLSQQIVIDQVELDGVQASLQRRKDGSLNIDDLLAQGEGPALKFDLAGSRITNARLDWRDEISGRDLALNKIEVTAGRLANAARGLLVISAQMSGNNPKIDSAVELRASYDYDIDGRRFGLRHFQASTAGLLAGHEDMETSMTAAAIDIHPRENDNSWELQLETPALNANGKAGNARFELQLTAPQLMFAADQASARALNIGAKFQDARGNLDARLDLSGIAGTLGAMKAESMVVLLDAQAGATTLKGRLSSTWVANLPAQTMNLPGFSGDIEVANPQILMSQVKLPFSGTLNADFAKQSALGALSSQFGQSKIKMNFQLTRFIPMALGFAVDIDRLNLDRYLPPGRGEEKVLQADGRGEQRAPQLSEGSSPSSLGHLQLQGSVRIGLLQYARVKARNVRLELKAADGKLKLDAASSKRTATPDSNSKSSVTRRQAEGSVIDTARRSRQSHG